MWHIQDGIGNETKQHKILKMEVPRKRNKDMRKRLKNT